MALDAGLDCARIEADSILLLDGGLDALRVEAVHAHFAVCPRCAAFFRDLRHLLVREVDATGSVDFSAVDFAPTDFGALAARLEGADLRDWVDGSQVEGVDLREVARHFARPPVDTDRLDALIRGMRAVGRYQPALAAKAEYYVGLAHIKAKRADAAVAALSPLRGGEDAGLARLAQITLAVIPGMLCGAPADSVEALGHCLCGDAFDGLVHFNLAQARFEAAGERVDAGVLVHVAQARTLAPGLVERQLSVPSARRLRRALSEAEAR